MTSPHATVLTITISHHVVQGADLRFWEGERGLIIIFASGGGYGRGCPSHSDTKGVPTVIYLFCIYGT